jgi:hypothetical protein
MSIPLPERRETRGPLRIDDDAGEPMKDMLSWPDNNALFVRREGNPKLDMPPAFGLPPLLAWGFCKTEAEVGFTEIDIVFPGPLWLPFIGVSSTIRPQLLIAANPATRNDMPLAFELCSILLKFRKTAITCS